MPGVKAATEISTGIYVRGGSPDQNLTLVDGVVVYNPSHLGGFASTFNSDALQDIKLLKGAFPAEYGGRLSSVLDVTMREGTKEKFIGTAGINVISSRLTFEGPLSENSTFIISGRKMYLDKILPLIPESKSIPRYNFYDFNGKVNYVISENDRIAVTGFFSKDNLLEPPNNKDIGFDIGWDNSTVNLTWTKINSARIFTNTSFMYTNYNFFTLIKDKLPSKEPLDFFTSSYISDFLLRSEMEIYLGESHSIKTGAEIVYHDFTTTTSDFFIKELLYKRNYGTNINALEAGLYVQDDIQPSQDLKANLGVRLSYFQNSKLLALEPRLSATYYLLDRLILRGAFAMANQSLHMLVRNDVYLPTDVWYPSTANIKPSQSMQGSIGLEATSFDRAFLFSIEAYYKDLKNLYEYKANADFSYQTDFEDQVIMGKGESYGYEFFLNKRLGDFMGWIGYTLSWTKRHFEELNRGIAFYPRYDRRHDISFVLTFQPSNNLTMGITWVYGTGQAFSLPIGQYSFASLTQLGAAKPEIYLEYSARDAFRLPPFHKLDLSAGYSIYWGNNLIDLSFNIYNVYNRYNAFSKYVGYKIDEKTGEKIPVLKQFTLFPFLPTIGINFQF